MSRNVLSLIETLILTSIFIWGVYYCNNINAQGDGKNFLSRFICLHLPTTIRFHLIFILVMGILAIVYTLATKGTIGDQEGLITLPIVIAHILLHIFLYTYLGKKIRYVSGGSPEL